VYPPPLDEECFIFGPPARKPRGRSLGPAISIAHIHRSSAMLARKALLLLAMTVVAGSAFAASPQAASTAAQPAKSTAVKSEHKNRTCEKQGKTGHCEKWSKSETKAAAKK